MAINLYSASVPIFVRQLGRVGLWFDKAEALETTLDVDIFCPPRQDWLDGSDAYLRSK